MTDDRSRELFVYCIKAYNAGQEEIGFTIFPERLSDATYAKMGTRYSRNKDDVKLWGDLKKSNDLFCQTIVPPTVKFLPDGMHEVH
jgi:hypothetical protein